MMNSIKFNEFNFSIEKSINNDHNEDIINNRNIQDNNKNSSIIRAGLHINNDLTNSINNLTIIDKNKELYKNYLNDTESNDILPINKQNNIDENNNLITSRRITSTNCEDRNIPSNKLFETSRIYSNPPSSFNSNKTLPQQIPLPPSSVILPPPTIQIHNLFSTQSSYPSNIQNKIFYNSVLYTPNTQLIPQNVHDNSNYFKKSKCTTPTPTPTPTNKIAYNYNPNFIPFENIQKPININNKHIINNIRIPTQPLYPKTNNIFPKSHHGIPRNQTRYITVPNGKFLNEYNMGIKLKDIYQNSVNSYNYSQNQHIDNSYEKYKHNSYSFPVGKRKSTFDLQNLNSGIFIDSNAYNNKSNYRIMQPIQNFPQVNNYNMNGESYTHFNNITPNNKQSFKYPLFPRY
ncbi:ICE-like protease p20 domain-containing protein [Cryptosporidium serpentis]